MLWGLRRRFILTSCSTLRFGTTAFSCQTKFPADRCAEGRCPSLCGTWALYT